ncbi:MAG: ferritin-like domain-containing protein [Caldilineaceae bacterium]
MAKSTNTEMKDLNDLYVEQLQDLYDAENQLIKALPKMADAATAPDLKKGFTQHLNQTQTHAERLETILSNMGVSLKGKPCEAMKGLIKEGDEVIKMKGDSDVKDAALIAAAQRVEHYEIAGYGTVRTFAQHLGESDARELLQVTLDEEGETDKKLTSLAEGGLFKNGINAKAMDDNGNGSSSKKNNGQSNGSTAKRKASSSQKETTRA